MPSHRHKTRRESRPYGGLPPHERKAERRRRLLAAGLKLFGTAGYPAISIEALCRQARVTARHFYEEFKTKEALLEAVYDLIADETLAAVELGLADATEDLAGRATAGIGAFVHTLLDDPRRARVACIEVVGVSRKMERHRRIALHRFARIIEAEVRAAAGRGELAVTERDPSIASLALVGGTFEIIVETLESKRLSVEELIEDLVRLFMAIASSVMPGAVLAPEV